MRLVKAMIFKYRSIRDTTFEIEGEKTIMVGPNEAGKTAALRALQQLNPPLGVARFDVLRDYPRSEYNDVTTGKVKPAETTVVEGTFALEAADIAAIPAEFAKCTYVLGRKYDNNAWNRLDGAPPIPRFGGIKNDLLRLAAHVRKQVPAPAEGEVEVDPTSAITTLVKDWLEDVTIEAERATALRSQLESLLEYIDEGNEAENNRYQKLHDATQTKTQHDKVLKIVAERLPVFCSSIIIFVFDH
jgi:energy-coupling factor transporter ATP-binding protein EcfA2